MVLKDLDCQDKELSIIFVNDNYIAQLNKYYLHRNGPTDVIAFPMFNKEEEQMGIPLLGDIVISVDTAIKESEEFGEKVEDTIYRLVIHGILHLLGYDHEGSKNESDKMIKEEIRLLSKIKGEVE